MAGRNRQPVDVLEARGKKHLTKAEKAKRKAEEATVPPHLRDAQAPEYLMQWPDLASEFCRLADMLRELIPENFGQPDAGLLARYVVSEHLYEAYTSQLVDAIEPCDIKSLQIAQDRAFKQANACASALGLTVTSRCKLVVPAKVENDAESEF